MSQAKVKIESLAHLYKVINQSINEIEEVKIDMDRALESIPWDDPVALSFKQNYDDGLKPINMTLIPNLEEYSSYLCELGKQIDIYSEEGFMSTSSGVKGGGKVAGVGIAAAVGAGIFASWNSMKRALNPFRSIVGDFHKDFQESGNQLKKEAEDFSSAFEKRIKDLDDDELEKMSSEWEEIETCAHLSNESYKQPNRMRVKGYIPLSEADINTLDGFDSDLSRYITSANREANPHDLRCDPATGYCHYTPGEAHGFFCELYKAPDNKYVLAFRGTDQFAEWVKTDPLGAIDRNESQNQYAREVTRQLISKGIKPESLIVTGHSLGGRLAQEAAIEHGLKAYVYNSAELSRYSKGLALKGKKDWNITSISSCSDPLTIAQNSSIGRSIVGPDIIHRSKRIVLMNDGGHGINDLAYTAGNERLKILQELYTRRNS